jgi:hypothetical protein
MLPFILFLKEEAEEGEKLKHITHAEDRPLQNGASGFKLAHDSLMAAHHHMKSGGHSSALTMKYDGSPSLVFGHHPETGKFFVASKSAFNKNPKINYTHKDIEKNHGHAPGLMDKLHASLNHLKKIAPKSGVYQGDLMYTHDDLKHHKGGKTSFTPNTIRYTAHGGDVDKIKKSKMGIIVHQQYHGKDISSMKADPHPDLHNFAHHPDVWHKSANHDTKQIHYSEKDQEEFNNHMAIAKDIHSKNKGAMYKNTQHHAGEGGHLEQYINHTVRTGETPNSDGLKKMIGDKIKKSAAKLKTPAGQSRKESEIKAHHKHIDDHKEHYDNILQMHHHLQQAKDVLVRNLEQHEGGFEHHIEAEGGKFKRTGPEGFVINHAGQPTKLVNRKEFARANLLKVRK